MNIGYARVSTADQSLDLQTDAMTQAGCQRIITDAAVSGTAKERPQLERLLQDLRQGDVLVVWKLDRLGRNLQHLVEIVELFRAKDVGPPLP